MKLVYLFLEEDGSVLGYSEQPVNNTYKKYVNEEFLDPNVFNHYYMDKDGNLVRMSEEEFAKRRPYFNKPILNDTQILKAQKNVLAKRNSNLEECIIELTGMYYELKEQVTEMLLNKENDTNEK